MKKQAEQIDELSKDTLVSYHGKAKEDSAKAYDLQKRIANPAKQQELQDKINKRFTGMRKAFKKVNPDKFSADGSRIKEETLDEVSKEKLDTYIHKSFQHGNVLHKEIEKETDPLKRASLRRKLSARNTGVIRAAKRLTTEDTSDKAHIEQHLADKDINSSVSGNTVKVHSSDVEATKKHLAKAGYKHEVVGGLNESDAAYAAALEKQKENKLTKSDQASLAKVRELMAKEKKLKEETEEQKKEREALDLKLKQWRSQQRAEKALRGESLEETTLNKNDPHGDYKEKSKALHDLSLNKDVDQKAVQQRKLDLDKEYAKFKEENMSKFVGFSDFNKLEEKVGDDVISAKQKMAKTGKMSLKDKLLSIPRGFKAAKAGKSEVDANLKESAEDKAAAEVHQNLLYGSVKSKSAGGVHDIPSHIKSVMKSHGATDYNKVVDTIRKKGYTGKIEEAELSEGVSDGVGMSSTDKDRIAFVTHQAQQHREREQARKEAEQKAKDAKRQALRDKLERYRSSTLNKEEAEQVEEATSEYHAHGFTSADEKKAHADKVKKEHGVRVTWHDNKAGGSEALRYHGSTQGVKWASHDLNGKGPMHEDAEQVEEGTFDNIPKGKASWDYYDKKRAERNTEHEKQDPKMHAKHYAKNMVDTEKAAKKAKEHGIKKSASDFDWKVRNGVQRGKLPEEVEVEQPLSMVEAALSVLDSGVSDFRDTYQLDEGTVHTKKYKWGTMKTVHHGSDFSIPLHPEHHKPIAKLKDGQEHHFKDETGKHWGAYRRGSDVHFISADHSGAYKTTVKHSSLHESLNEDHVVAVSDGSKYDEEPHHKDIEHVKAGVSKHGGEFDGHSDKGAFFKFKSHSDAENFRKHVNACPHKSCSAEHLDESVQIDEISLETSRKVHAARVDQFHKARASGDAAETEHTKAKMQKAFKHYFNKDKKELAKLPKADPAAEYAYNKAKGFSTEEVELEEEFHVVANKSYYGDKSTPVKLSSHKSKEDAEAALTKHKAEDAKHKGYGAYSTRWHKVVDSSGLKSHMKEDVEQIDELSKDTLASYAKKAADDTALRARYDNRDQPSPSKKTIKRLLGTKKAIDKLAKEEAEQIDELSKKTLGNYINKASANATNHATTARGIEDREGRYTPDSVHHDFKKQDRLKGIKTAVKKLTQEEAEELDELNKSTLASYANKSHDQLMKHTSTVNFKTGRGDKDAFSYEHDKDNMRKTANRTKGFKQAISKLAKEETEQIDEMTQGKEYTQKQLTDKIKTGNWEATHDIKPGKHVEMRHHTGKKVTVFVKEEVEQIDELSKVKLVQYVDKATQDIHNKAMAAGQAKPGEASKFISNYNKSGKRQAGVVKAAVKLAREETDMISYKNFIELLGESKIDDLKDRIAARKATQSAYDSDYKPADKDDSKRTVKGKSYGAGKEDDGEDENKKQEPQEKRGRGRPAGSKSGARV